MEQLPTELCKQKADECVELAERSSELDHKIALLRLAKGWIRLATAIREHEAASSFHLTHLKKELEEG
jgi:hypothetical protein